MKTEIIKTEKTNVDFGKVQLVRSEESGSIVLTSGEHSGDRFCGTVIFAGSSISYQAGYYSKTWIKDYFKPVTEDLTIKFIV